MEGEELKTTGDIGEAPVVIFESADDINVISAHDPENKKDEQAPTLITPQSPAKEPETKKPKGRAQLVGNFSAKEYEDLEPVINARIDAKITSDRNHFVRQCIDFAVNHNHFVELKGYVPGKTALSFGVPDNTRVNIKNAIFNPEDFK